MRDGLEVVREIENKWGSITDCPDDEPLLKESARLLNTSSEYSRGRKIINVSIEDQREISELSQNEKIQTLLNKGYPKQTILRHLHIPHYVVTRLINENIIDDTIYKLNRKPRYVLYHRDEEIGRGTLEEISEQTGLTETTVRIYLKGGDDILYHGHRINLLYDQEGELL